MACAGGGRQEGCPLTAPDASWDVAIVDLVAPHYRGLQTLAACRARKPWQKLVALAEPASPYLRALCSALGADAVFDKCAELDALMEYCLALKPVVRMPPAAAPREPMPCPMTS